jgi:osmotically-inducible protein OsmY
MFAKLLVSSVMASLMTMAAVPAVSAQTRDRKDSQVLQDVARQVREYVHYSVFDDIGVSVSGGSVTLTGKVTMPYKRDDIERRVRRVDGVHAVDNRIEVLPVSPFDDELRYVIARAIYGNPSFWHYASMVNPPIHIVVDRGHVTLSGVVNSNVDRMLARSLASGFGAFSVTNALKTDAEVAATLETATE